MSKLSNADRRAYLMNVLLMIILTGISGFAMKYAFTLLTADQAMVKFEMVAVTVLAFMVGFMFAHLSRSLARLTEEPSKDSPNDITKPKKEAQD